MSRLPTTEAKGIGHRAIAQPRFLERGAPRFDCNALRYQTPEPIL